MRRGHVYQFGYRIMGGDLYFGAEAKQKALAEMDEVEERRSEHLEMQFDMSQKPLKT